MSTTDIKQVVREKYGEAALRVTRPAAVVVAQLPPALTAVIPLPRTSTTRVRSHKFLRRRCWLLGCGNPTALAKLSPGEVVLDLGSGGGIDVLVSARRVGPTGRAYGLDMTDEMLALANGNKRKSGIENVEFLKGEIENIPLSDNSVDVIISNCVINLLFAGVCRNLDRWCPPER